MPAFAVPYAAPAPVKDQKCMTPIGHPASLTSEYHLAHVNLIVSEGVEESGRTAKAMPAYDLS